MIQVPGTAWRTTTRTMRNDSTSPGARAQKTDVHGPESATSTPEGPEGPEDAPSDAVPVSPLPRRSDVVPWEWQIPCNTYRSGWEKAEHARQISQTVESFGPVRVLSFTSPTLAGGGRGGMKIRHQRLEHARREAVSLRRPLDSVVR